MLQQYLGQCERLRSKLHTLSPSLCHALEAAIIGTKTLICTFILSLLGLFDQAEHWMLQCLAGHPFYMSALEAQNDLISSASRAWISLLITYYLAYVLLGEKDGRKRCAIVILSLASLSFASFSAIFWGGVLNLFAPMAAICTLSLGLKLHSLFAQYLDKRQANNA